MYIPGMYNQKIMKDNILINEEQKNPALDVSIENVLNWSTAKNLQTLELPSFERNNFRGSISK